MKSNHVGASRAELYQNIGITATVNGLPIGIDVTNGFAARRPACPAKDRAISHWAQRETAARMASSVENGSDRNATRGGEGARRCHNLRLIRS